MQRSNWHGSHSFHFSALEIGQLHPFTAMFHYLGEPEAIELHEVLFEPCEWWNELWVHFKAFKGWKVVRKESEEPKFVPWCAIFYVSQSKELADVVENYNLAHVEHVE